MSIHYISDGYDSDEVCFRSVPGTMKRPENTKSSKHDLTLRLNCKKCGTTSSILATENTNPDAASASRDGSTDSSSTNTPRSDPETQQPKKEDSAPVLTRIGRWVKEKDKEKRLVDEANWEPPFNPRKDGSYAVVVDDKITFDWQGNEIRQKQELSLVSQPLIDAFVSVVEYYPGISLEGNEIVLTAPYAPLFFYFEQLCSVQQQDEGGKSELSADIRVLADFYTRWVQPEHDNIRKRIDNKVALFEDLWAVFCPGDHVYSLDEFGEPSLHVLGATEYRSPETQGYREDPFSIRRFKRFSADLWSVTWDKASGKFQRITVTRSIRIYSEARKVNRLPFYPLAYYEDGDKEKIEALRELLRVRGNQWKELVAHKPSCKYYEGAATHLSAGNDSEYLSERVIIDGSATTALMGIHGRLSDSLFRQQMPGLLSGGGNRNQSIEYEWNVHGAGRDRLFSAYDDFPAHGEFDDLQVQLCPSSIVCYGIKSRAWFEASVSKLTPVNWETDSLRNLVIDPDTKEMLSGLVHQHRKNRDRGLRDLVQFKGKGLIVVLYGNPGVGKTLTAETVAEYTEKPLYPINIGELTSKHEIVNSLEMHFSRASRWDAVLLLDEADVLLEKRSYENLQRNGIVSVFLRMLEYYEGIIFLTTNRLLTMDAAFESRIQLAIRLPDLTASSRRRIWTNLINRLDPEEEFGKQELIDHLDEMEKWELNGRQIRNILATAESLALGTQHRRGALRFKMVQKMANEVIRFHDFFEEGAHERKAQLGVINPRQFQERRSRF